ncbi:hypothetical protein [Burkholderia pseudomallei]|uniref:hypothetical protein n=1 Tax=Burkholderia pseudomallei TaxID=28450 RepID=UPI00217559EB|nr:hypothetical protein [Burkholderia pseudomallei]
MDAATKHENRYRAVIEYANGAMFNVAELDAWAVSNKVQVSFESLLKDEHIAENYDAANHFIHYGVLSITLASRFVPPEMDPSEASIQLMAAGDVVKHKDPARRLRDLVMVRYDRQLLSAVFDGDLFLYDTLTMSRIDIGAARMRYGAEPEAYLQAAQARLIDTAQGTVTPADIEQAKKTIELKFARLDHLAWAIVILTADVPPSGEDRYRQILSATRWLQSLGLPFRHGNGLPASQPKGVPVAGIDVREYQYLAVEDVRTAAIEARCWPTEEKGTPPMPLISDFAPRPVRLPNASRVNVEWLVREIAFALVEIPDDKRLATLKKETPDGPGRWNIEPLTGDDWRLIREICGSKPPAPCSPAQFEAWRAPFDTAPNGPDWDLCPEFKPSNEMQAAQSRWSLFNVQHLQQIRQKAERKELSFITPAGIETSDIYDNAGLAVGCLRIADAKAYLDQCCIAWEVAIPDVAPPAPDRSEQAIPIESLFTQPGFERNYQMLVAEPGISPAKTAITSALIASAKAGETLKASIRTVTRKGEKWSDASLRTLLEESKMPGFTQKAAAEKYGVTPQRISALLKQAKDKFETPAKASFFPTAGTQIRKVKGKQYK